MYRDGTTGGAPPVQAGTVPFYAEQADECLVFEHAFRQRLPVLLKGPTGCGKTRFVEHMAARLQRPLARRGGGSGSGVMVARGCTVMSGGLGAESRVT